MFQVTIVPLVLLKRAMRLPLHCYGGARQGITFLFMAGEAPPPVTACQMLTTRFFITSWDAQHDGDSASSKEGGQPVMN